VSQQVNLYNPALLPKPDVFSARVVLACLAASLALAVVLSASATWNATQLAEADRVSELHLTQTRDDITRMTQDLTARKPNSELTAELESLDALYAGRSEVIEVLKSGSLGDTNGVSGYFKALARENVEGLWLTGFTVVGAGKDITLEGRTLRADLVATYLRKLGDEEILRGHAFAMLRVQKPPIVPGQPAGASAARPEYLEFRMGSHIAEASTPSIAGVAR